MNLTRHKIIIQQHVPVMYLGVDQESNDECVSGDKSLLPGETDTTMTPLTIIRNCWGEQVIT